jgi:hypothetical protein
MHTGNAGLGGTVIQDRLMEEIWERKERLSLRIYSQTPEERRKDIEETMKIAQAALGRPLELVRQTETKIPVSPSRRA